MAENTQDWPAASWTVGFALAVLLAGYAALLTAMVVSGVLLGQKVETLAGDPLLGQLFVIGLITSQCLVTFLLTGPKLSSLASLYRLRTRPKPQVLALYAVFGALVHRLAYWIWRAWSHWASVESPLVPQSSEIHHKLGPASVTVLMCLVGIKLVLGVVYEETVFRGLFFGALRSRRSFVVATLITSLLFYACHLEAGSTGLAGRLGMLNTWLYQLQNFVLGVYLCWTVERSRSLYPAMATHLLVNIGAVIPGIATL